MCKSEILDPRAATWLAETIARRQAQFGGWQMMAEPEPGNDPTGDPAPDPTPSTDPKPDKGYPENTRVEDMKPEQQAAYYRAQARRHEHRNKELLDITGGKYGDDLKALLDERQALIDAGRTDAEKAVEDARREGHAKARGEYGTKLVAAKFEAALAHLDEQRRDQIIEGISLEKYLTDSGDVATDKVRAYAATIAPTGKGSGERDPDYGGGRRNGGSTDKGGSIAQIRADRAAARAARS
ncbi:hypothetical protein GCM10009737_08230 [Nocardioides lentus]|uniref:DUF4355 domain-containing protein n=1 Tax=Nocardioides lentus TaxID=338077 RepID=A0ABN2P273_9ACTN